MPAIGRTRQAKARRPVTGDSKRPREATMLDFLSNPNESHEDWLQRLLMELNRAQCNAARQRDIEREEVRDLLRDEDAMRIADLDRASGVNEPCDENGIVGGENE